MKFEEFNLKQKLYMLIYGTIMICLLLTIGLMSLFYSVYHPRISSQSLLELTEAVADETELEEYAGSDINEKIRWVSEKFNINLYHFNSIEELNKDSNMSTITSELISSSEAESLLSGEPVIKTINAEELGCKLSVVVYPLQENHQVDSFLLVYLPTGYVPIQEKFISLLWIVTISLFLIGLFIFGKNSWKELFERLKTIETAAVRVSKGDYDTKIEDENSRDEIGEITTAFNSMSTAIRDDRQRISDFIADLSHEMKTPLTYIESYNQALMDGLVTDENEKEKCMKLITRETKRLQNLVQNLLDLAKLDAHSVVLQDQPIVFAQLIEELMCKFEPILAEKNLSLNAMLNYGIIINGDEERLEQIIQNIIQNAIQYSKDGGVITVMLADQGENCLLSIMDNGIGISKKNLEIITNRFIREKKITSRYETGTGIGLSIVERLMNLHGGKMTIYSELHVGTTVNLQFPILQCGLKGCEDKKVS